MTFSDNPAGFLGDLLRATESLELVPGALKGFWSLAEQEYPDSLDGALARRSEFIGAR